MTSSEIVDNGGNLPVVTFEGAEPSEDNYRYEAYSIATNDPNILLKGEVITSDRYTRLGLREPKRADATEEESATGRDRAGLANHVRMMKVEIDHRFVGPPSQGKKIKALSHLAAAMLALKEPEE